MGSNAKNLIVPGLLSLACVRERHSFVLPGRHHVELHLRHGNRLALRLDRKAVLLIVAGGEVAADAGQDLAHRSDASGRIKHRPIHLVV
jgi:hypothetical protein